MLNETEIIVWEVKEREGERERENSEREKWVQVIVLVGVKFDLRGVMFGLKGLFGRRRFFWRSGVLKWCRWWRLFFRWRVLTWVVTVVVTELVIRVGTELVTGVQTLCIVFSLLFGGYPHCPSSFLNWLRFPSPQAVLPVNVVFAFSFYVWLEMILLMLVVQMLLQLLLMQLLLL